MSTLSLITLFLIKKFHFLPLHHNFHPSSRRKNIHTPLEQDPRPLHASPQTKRNRFESRRRKYTFAIPPVRHHRVQNPSVNTRGLVNTPPVYIVKQKPSEPLFSSRGRGNCVRGRAPRLFCEPNLRDWSLTSHFRRSVPSLSRSDIDWGSQKRVVRAWSFTVRLCLPFLRPRTRRKRTMGGERRRGIRQKKFRVRRFLSVLHRDDPHRDEGIVQRRRISFGKKYITVV